MWGYRDKRVTVRFTEPEFEKYEKLLQRLPSLGAYSTRTWTRLIHRALQEMYDRYDTPEAAEKKKPAKRVGQRSASDAAAAVRRKSAKR